MKIFTYALMAIGLGLIIFNSTKLDFDNLFEGDSAIAAIGIMAGLCAIVLMLVFQISLKIKEKSKKRGR